ncbi:MAG: hypothetical protein LBS23_02790 [Holosporaceae bacterium]|nr:hypothetical protein [Holosporaceae bacterium]
MVDVLSCFFPTTVVFIDDNVSFLESIPKVLNIDRIIAVLFTNPLEALDYINKTNCVNKLDCADLIRNYEEESSSDWKSVMFNINRLHQKIYSSDRFANISTVVSDCAMSELDGIELCAKIENKNIQKILLTGETEETKAIGAFNNGYINRFLKKEVVDFEKSVTDAINKSIHQYFSIYTSDISKHLALLSQTHLNDPVFAHFFSNVCLGKSYVEYYMIDNFGSYLFLTAKGQTGMLSVLTEKEMERIIKIGIESGEIASNVLEALQSREYMLVSHNRTGLLPPISEWDRYIQPARRLDGYHRYYFSLADSKRLDIDFENIKAFADSQKDIVFRKY